MRKYDEKLIKNLQNNVKVHQENGIPFEIKPIPELDKTNGMDPRMLKVAKKKALKLHNNFSVDSFQLYEERYRPDKINYDLTTKEIIKKQQLVKVKDHYINTFFYRPKNTTGKLPAILYVHGGAFMAGDHIQFENQCKLIAEKSGALVVFPEYRLAPENPFPAGLEDIFGILNWIYDRKHLLNIDGNKIIMVGDSAGASIMNGCALLDQRNIIRLLFEIYPCSDTDIIGNKIYKWDLSYYQIPDEEQKYVYSRMNRLKNACEGIVEFYQGIEKGTNPLMSIVYQEDFKKFPQTVIVIGEYDFLRISADIFAKKCLKAEKLKRAIRYQGCDHGFFDMLGILPQAEDIILEIAKEVKQLEEKNKNE